MAFSTAACGNLESDLSVKRASVAEVQMPLPNSLVRRWIHTSFFRMIRRYGQAEYRGFPRIPGKTQRPTTHIPNGFMAAFSSAIWDAVSGWTGCRQGPTSRPERLVAAFTAAL